MLVGNKHGISRIEVLFREDRPALSRTRRLLWQHHRWRTPIQGESKLEKAETSEHQDGER